MQFSAAQTLLKLLAGQTVGFTSNSAAQDKILLNKALHELERDIGYNRKTKNLFSRNTYAHWPVASVKPTLTGVEGIVAISSVNYTAEGQGRPYVIDPVPYDNVIENFGVWSRRLISETLDNAAAVDATGGVVTFPITGTDLEEGDRITVDGTTNYDATYFVIAAGADSVNVYATYVAETFAGTETVVTDTPSDISVSLLEYGYDEHRGFVVYPAQSGDGKITLQWSCTGDDLDGDTDVPDILPPAFHYHWVERAVYEWLLLEAGQDDPRTLEYYQNFVLPGTARIREWAMKLLAEPYQFYGNRNETTYAR